MEDYQTLEPEDINIYTTIPLPKIKNNCNPRNYKWVLFPKEIAANQLEQAGGTCYLVSAIESLSHIPNLLDYIFPNAKNFSPFNDSFKVQFYGINIKGKPTTFYINNKFPIESNFNLKLMKPLENEAYGIILEKAWASLVGGYKNIDGGRAYKVLNKLLGIMKKWKF